MGQLRQDIDAMTHVLSDQCDVNESVANILDVVLDRLEAAEAMLHITPETGETVSHKVELHGDCGTDPTNELEPETYYRVVTSDFEDPALRPGDVILAGDEGDVDEDGDRMFSLLRTGGIFYDGLGDFTAVPLAPGTTFTVTVGESCRT